MAVIEMSDREQSRLRLMINLLDGGSGLQRLAFGNRHGETAALRDAEPPQGGTLRLAAKQATGTCSGASVILPRGKASRRLRQERSAEMR